MIILERGKPFQKKAGKCNYQFKGDIRFKRAWWLWFAVTWIKMDLKEFHDHVQTGATEWKQ